jgi:CubicO group peptidase (beta-lactamase class C family)
MIRRGLLSLALCTAIYSPAFGDTPSDQISQKLSPKTERARAVLEGFDEIVLNGMEEFDIPGLAIGIIADGQIVYTKGFGLRDIKKKLPATTDTLFQIGSCTKAFTAFAIGSLVEEGLLDWDQPVIDILQEFRLWDQYATQNLTIRDLLSHRSGLPRHDFMWYNSNISMQDVLSRLRYLEPAGDIRERFNYNNLMYLVLGAAIERVSKNSWQDVIREKILLPLGMSQTGFTPEEMHKYPNYATPFLTKGDSLKEIACRDISPIGPAGSIYSSVNEMCKWLQLQIDCGTWNDQPLIGYGTLKEMHAPQVVISGYPDSKETRVSAYGLGWCVQTYRGIYNVSHDGAVDGFTSIVSFLPQEGLGFVILCNKNLTPLPRILGMHAFDRLLELPLVDWLEEGIEGISKNREAFQESKLTEDLNRKKGTVPSHPIEEFVGWYEDPGYGQINLVLEDGELKAKFNGIVYHLGHWHYNTFSAERISEELIVPREGLKFSFSSNVNGEIDTLSIPFESRAADIVFKRKALVGYESIAYLRQFLGTYELYGYTVDIILKNNKLFSVIPGQPIYELVAGGDKEFSIKSHAGYIVRFVMSSTGSVEELLLVQPYGVVFSAKPKKLT